jgi:hypothetical protein
MSQENTLDKKVAESFIEDSSSVDLSTYTEITVEAAEVLSGYGKREGDRPDGQLDLSRLTEISEECAEALENHSGEINLYGLKELSPKIASKLGKKTGTLLLNGLNTISLEVAEALAGQSDGYLSLDGLESIDIEIAGALAKHTGGYLSLDGLSEISEDVAGKLITSSDELRIGLTEISDSVARVLARCSGNLTMENLSIVDLSNLAAYLFHIADSRVEISNGEVVSLKNCILTKDIAEEMVINGFPSDEILAEFTSIDDDAADVFGKSYGVESWLSGEVESGMPEEIKLVGLNQLSENSAEKLSHFKGGILNIQLNEHTGKEIQILLQKLSSETSFCLSVPKLNVSLHDSLAQFQGRYLELGVSELSETAASALSKYKGSLSLNQFIKTEFTPTWSGKELVKKRQGEFSLQISDKSAEMISMFKGESLSIKGANLSDIAKKNLASNLTIEFYLETDKISEDGAHAFGTFKGPKLELEVSELSPACAAALASYGGKLSLIYLKEISDEAAEKLAQYSGPEIQIMASNRMNFEISDAALISLSKIKNILTLPYFPEASDNVIGSFVKRSIRDSVGRTVHDVIRRANKISSANLKEIVKQHSRVDLELREISDEAAEILSNNQGKLVLSGLRKISDNCASILAKHTGELYLLKDVEITAQGMETLKKHPGSLFFFRKESLQTSCPLQPTIITDISPDFD